MRDQEIFGLWESYNQVIANEVELNEKSGSPRPTFMPKSRERDIGKHDDWKNVREEVLSYLLDGGFASDEKSAEAIMGAMSEAWVGSIVEAKVDEKLPEHERSGARLDRYDNPSGALALGGGQQRARREEHRERRGKKK